MDTEAKKGGTKPQIAIYQQIASREDEIINVLFDLLQSRNESVAVSAAKTLLGKILPDKKAVEVGGVNGEPIKFTIIGGADYTAYISGLNKTTTTSTAGVVGGPNEVQDINLAQTGEKNNNGNNPVS
jgi:hypothetical protein